MIKQLGRRRWRVPGDQNRSRRSHQVRAVTNAYAAAETSALAGTEAMVFRICEAIW